MSRLAELADCYRKGDPSEITEMVGLFEAEIKDLQAIVDKLDKTKDNVPVVPWVDRVFWTGGHPSNTGQPLIVREKGYVSHGGDGILFNDGTPVLVSDCYSTEAAAEAAKKE